MSGVTHAAVGAALGTTLVNPALALAAGVISHLVLDALPHNEWFPLCGEVISSMVFLSLLGLLSFPDQPGMFCCALGAVLPDLEIVGLTFWHSRVPEQKETLFHRFVRQPVAYGLLSRGIQLGLLLAASGYLFYYALT